MAGPGILIVEDNFRLRELLRRRLERRGYRVILAEDGRQGLERMEAERPAVVLLDMSLPVLDGWTMARLAKLDPRLRHIPIVALTAHAMPHDREQAIAAGCDEYLAKPLAFEELLGLLQALLGSEAKDD